MTSFRIPLLGLLLFLCCWEATGEVGYMKYKDPKQPLNVRIKDLMSRMTLAEKIGQTVQIDRTVASAEVMKKYFIGSILSGPGSVPAPQASAETWINMVNDFQKGCLSTHLGIPLIYGIDAVHGHNNVYKATNVPHNVGLGATRDSSLVKKIGAATALEVRATGISYVFAPCIAVCRDPSWGGCYESYSGDPKVVQAMTEIIPGLQGEIPANSRKGVPYLAGNNKVAACAKHYVGDGGTNKGIDQNNTIIDPHDLFSIHMPAYLNSIIKGVSTVMVSYSSWNGVKMHANHDLVANFLKNKLRFRGFVISDWAGIDRITTPEGANYSYSIDAGMNAGIDMEHRELAREAVRKSLVLLKNGKSDDKPLLPFSKRAPKILVAGNHADNLGYQCGGWTITWQGLSGNNLTSATVDHTTEVVYSENPSSKFVKSSDFSNAIVIVGEHPYTETFGDSMNLTMPDPCPDTIKNVCSSAKCVIVIISGRPIVIKPYLSSMDALVAAWLPGTEGQGIADVLFGDYGFSGKLSHTWFKFVDQLPMNVGDPQYDPLFPFGYGLTTEPVMMR